MALDSLRIDSAPAAFSEIARKHNALLAVIAAMNGANGVTVTVSENNIVVTGTGDPGLEARVAALEALLEDYADTSVETCPSGTITVLAK